MKLFKNKQNSASSTSDEVLDCHAISRLIRHFPVGGKLQYYPEYVKEILLESVVIAYIINDEIVYSVANQKCEGNPGILEFDDQGKHYSFEKITFFRVVLPVFNQSETKLDYIRREELLRVGGLINGNVITLMAKQDSGHVPVLETIVDKRAILKDGFYANQTVAYLEPDINSMMLSDQRTHLRLNTNIPATIQVSKRGEFSLLNCVMTDFSDRSLRLQIDDEFSAEAIPKQKSKLTVSFNLPGRSEYVSLAGEVFRVEDRSLVVTLTGHVENGQIVSLGQIEILKIKANLLQHTSTHLDK